MRKACYLAYKDTSAFPFEMLFGALCIFNGLHIQGSKVTDKNNCTKYYCFFLTSAWCFTHCALNWLQQFCCMKAIFYMIIILLFVQHGFTQLSRGDIVINEILFNPPKDGYDYVEGHNNSSTPIDLRSLKIASRNSAQEISSQKQITRDSVWLPPGGYFVVTGNEKWLRHHYYIPAEAIVCAVSSMPSFPDDKGIAILINDQDSIIDELSYSEKWHFPLIADPSGVALERINFAQPTQNPNNWTSAASSSGYGTPGYKNSEYQDGSSDNDIVIVPVHFLRTTMV